MKAHINNRFLQLYVYPTVIIALCMSFIPFDAEAEIIWPPDVVVVDAEGFLTRVPITGPHTVQGAVNYTTNYSTHYLAGNTTVFWYVADYKGEDIVMSTTVVVLDDEPPVFLDVPDHVAVVSKNGKRIPVTFEIPRAVDTIDLDVDVTSSHAPGYRFPPGNTTVRFTATDDVGNKAIYDMAVTVIHKKIENLVLESSHNGIRATWDGFEDQTTYVVSLTESGTGKRIQGASIRATTHTFSDLDSDTKYVVHVHVQGERNIKARSSALTLSQPLVLHDDFSSIEGWLLSDPDASTFYIDDDVGNPAPSLKFFVTSYSNLNGISKVFHFDRPLETAYFGIQSKFNHTDIGYLYLRGDQRLSFLMPLWGDLPTSTWNVRLNEVSRFLKGSENVTVGMSMDGPPSSLIHFDNLYLGEVPPSTFRGGSAEAYALTPEQEEVERVLAQVLDGDVDPYAYINGTRSLPKYNDFLVDMLSDLVDPSRNHVWAGSGPD